MEPYRTIRLEQRDHLMEVVFNRPRLRNAMSEEMGQELAHAVLAINSQADIRCVLFRGEGKAFAAGGDFRFIRARLVDDPEQNRRKMLAYYKLFLSVRDLHMPSIAAMHGAAIGAGLCFALACDLRLAADGTELGLNFVQLGLHPGMGATYFLPRLIGEARAAELLLTGRRFHAEEALSLGLVSSTHPQDQLLGAARMWARQIAQCAPLAVAKTKASLHHSLDRTLEEALLTEASAQALDYGTADMKEGLAAASEKRPARFMGS